MDDNMKRAIEEAFTGIENKDGGPFGAVIVQNGKIIATGHNCVISSHDPTAHAEIVAIRAATRKLERFDLSDCTLYTTCEPCPMCYSAAHWAKIKTVVYGATRNDAANIGFDDNYLYEVLSGVHENTQMTLEQKDRDACLDPFRKYEKDVNRTPY
ncbi:nucleoside deaminase [Fusibacter tunisiensis]|jgi:guanine deaminase|uniref:Guanine deaminase n=1 Tax=Fusibacter tunisiensis TaxID=1008308 RepID=A0ABS2MRV6_9FIRM|nr:nucleoside deaminase [Fusibacter tunisiensis]MBM7562128.1 guanine deaminase [Fusibacter tunisiensis]